MVYITGDIHGELDPIYELFIRHRPSKDDIIVILGDVGVNYTGTLHDRGLKTAMSKLESTFFCIHGNHENRPQNIASYKEKEWNGGRVMYEEDFPNLLFPIDGEIFDIEGKKCIVIGGAYSVDKYYRLRNGYKWWPDEQPSPTIKEYVEKQLSENKIDVVFSHTCPAKYIPTECFLSGIDQSRVDNSTEQWLDTIEDKLEYEAWYLGHWHIRVMIIINKDLSVFDLTRLSLAQNDKVTTDELKMIEKKNGKKAMEICFPIFSAILLIAIIYSFVFEKEFPLFFILVFVFLCLPMSIGLFMEKKKCACYGVVTNKIVRCAEVHGRGSVYVPFE